MEQTNAQFFWSQERKKDTPRVRVTGGFASDASKTCVCPSLSLCACLCVRAGVRVGPGHGGPYEPGLLRSPSSESFSDPLVYPTKRRLTESSPPGCRSCVSAFVCVLTEAEGNFLFSVPGKFLCRKEAAPLTSFIPLIHLFHSLPIHSITLPFFIPPFLPHTVPCY